MKETDGAVSLSAAEAEMKRLILLIEDKQQEIIVAAQTEKIQIAADLRRCNNVNLLLRKNIVV